MKFFNFIIEYWVTITTTISLPSTERCGENYYNQICDSGIWLLLYKYGYGKFSEDHCSTNKGCQFKFGECKDYSDV